MTRGARSSAYIAIIISVSVFSIGSPCHGTVSGNVKRDDHLIALASAKFSNLTRCERAVLEFADYATAGSGGDWPECGGASDVDDPINDPSHADRWDHQRDIRADLIRWLFVDPDASRRVDPQGISAVGARVVGQLNLSPVRAPFGLSLLRCVIPETFYLGGADIDSLTLSGSHTGEIYAGGSHIRTGVDLDDGFQASAQVFFGNSRIGRDFNASGGHFHHNPAQSNELNQNNDLWAAEKPALFLPASTIEGLVWLSGGFTADGAVDLNNVTCGGIVAHGGRFNNSGSVALGLNGANVSGTVNLGSSGNWSGMDATGIVLMIGAKVGSQVIATGATFRGSPDQPHGLAAAALSAKAGLILNNLTLLNGATLDLRGASTLGLIDDEKSWPRPGNLAIDDFVYHDFYGGPVDARSRLRWIALNSGKHPSWMLYPEGFHPQPYKELARVLRDRGDETGATRVLITADDLRYAQFGLPGRLWGAFLKYTIGYGHRPMLAIVWSGAVVMLGWIVVAVARRAGVMRLTWPETTPIPAGDQNEGLYPLVYSVDVFLPFVNLHQQHYWWPDPGAHGEFRIRGRSFRVRGSVVLYYLWTQIIAGWLLSAIFVAGVTGLIRTD